MDSERMINFFKETPVIPFSTIPTALMVGNAFLADGTNLNSEAIFRNVEIYEIPNWQRGKNKQVKIPYPGVPYVILSAKFGREVRGIVKDLRVKQGNKGKFPNQVSLDIALRDKVVNVMIFSDSMKIAGAQKPEHLLEAFVFIKAMVLALQRKFDAQGIPAKLFAKPITLAKLSVCMENLVFDLGFHIRKEALTARAIESGAFCPPETDGVVRVLYPMGEEKSKGGDRYYNFRVMHTGKVVYSGKNRHEMEPVYNKFMEFIKSHESEIRFV